MTPRLVLALAALALSAGGARGFHAPRPARHATRTRLGAAPLAMVATGTAAANGTAAGGAIGVADLTTASSMAMEVVSATPFSPRAGAKPRTPRKSLPRRVVGAIGGVLTAPFRALRLLGAARTAAGEARGLLDEACAIDGDAGECADASAYRSGLGEMRRLVSSTLGAAFGRGADARSADDDAGFAMQAGWEQRGQGSAFRRTIEVWRFLLSAVLRVVKASRLSKKGVPDADVSAAKTKAAEYIRDGLLQLGPTFIKLGQVISTRTDVLDAEYIAVLRSLQDDVPGFSGERAKSIVSKELGQPWERTFDSFEDAPIAAASLGQVHSAVLNGTRVAVKVQRAGLKELFDLDLKNLKVLAKLLDKFDPKTDGADREWAAIYDESARLLYLEIDYLNEARNTLRFAKNFEAQRDTVRVPQVYLEYSTPRVLTMEYVQGYKLTEVAKLESLGLDRSRLAKSVAETFLQQLLRDGYFHCDPHPGNLVADAQGRLVFYDFGMMDELSPGVRDGFREFCFALFGGGPYISDAQLAASAKRLVEAIAQMGVLSRSADALAVEKLARYFIRSFKDAQLGKGRSNIKSTLGNDLRTLTDENVFRFPSTFTFVFRAFASIDGIGKGLDESFDLGQLAQPFIEELTASSSTALDKFGAATGLNVADISSAVQSPRKVAYLERTVRAMEQGSLKIRVRSLENERALERLAAQQATTQAAVLAAVALNAAAAVPVAALTYALYAAAGAFGAQAAKCALSVQKIDKKNAQFVAPAFENTRPGGVDEGEAVDAEVVAD